MIIQIFYQLNNTVILSVNFFDQPNEVVFRSFSEIIQKLGKKNYYSRGAKVENLINYLSSNKNMEEKHFQDV